MFTKVVVLLALVGVSLCLKCKVSHPGPNVVTECIAFPIQVCSKVETVTDGVAAVVQGCFFANFTSYPVSLEEFYCNDKDLCNGELNGQSTAISADVHQLTCKSTQNADGTCVAKSQSGNKVAVCGDVVQTAAGGVTHNYQCSTFDQGTTSRTYKQLFCNDADFCNE